MVAAMSHLWHKWLRILVVQRYKYKLSVSIESQLSHSIFHSWGDWVIHRIETLLTETTGYTL